MKKKIKNSRVKLVKNWFMKYFDKVFFIVLDFFQALSKKIPKSVRKILGKSLLILLISTVSINIFINRYYLSPDQVLMYIQDKFVSMGHGNGFPKEIYGSNIDSQNFQILGGSLVAASDTCTTCYNKNSKEIFNRQHSFQSPMLKATKNKILLYDLYGKDLEISCKSKIIYKTNVDENILCAGLAENGTYGVVTSTSGYFSKLSVFKRFSKTLIYEYCFSDTYITNLDFSSNGKYACAVGLSSENGCMYSNLFVFDYKGETPKFKLQYKDSMVIKTLFLENGNIALIGDNMFSVVNPKNGKQEKYDFDNRNLTAFEINKNDKSIISLSSSDDGNACEILIFDKKGKLISNIKTDIKIKSMSFKDNKIAALSYDKVFVYNKKGKVLKELSCEQNSKEIHFFEPRKLYGLGISSIQKITF